MFEIRKLGLAAVATLAVAGTAQAQEIEVHSQEHTTLEAEMDEGVDGVDVDVKTDDAAAFAEPDMDAGIDDVDVDVDVEEGDQYFGLLAPNEAPITRVGTMLMVGGGVTNFTEDGPQALTNPGAAWDVRGVLGSRSVIGLEGAYTGSLQDIEALGLNSGAMLQSHGAEGALRVNAPVTIGDGLVLPYAFGGVGYKRYSLAFEDEGVTSSQVADHDDTLVVPVGVGFSAGLAGVTLDTRATYRQTFMTELVGDSTSSWDDTSLNSWALTAGLGFEF